MGISNGTTHRLREIGKIEFEERSVSEILANRPGIQVNLRKLENVKIPTRILQRGMKLRAEGRAKQNALYPWLFTVSGNDYESGTNLYFVNVSTHTCPCKYFTVTGSTCKHLVAALLTYMESRGVR